MELSKYPRTYHLPWSKGVQSDDKVLKNLSIFEGKEVVVTEKLDGENTTLYPDGYMHARSLDSRHNFTRDWVKKMHSSLRHDIPEGHKLCGENLWGEHSIRYPDGYLNGYFYLFSIWTEEGFCLDYDETLEYAELLDLPTPKQLYRGVWNEEILRELSKQLDTSLIEGYVVRTVKGFHKDDFQKHLSKFVREGHVQPNADHWLKNVKQNGLLNEKVMPFFMG